MECKELGEIKGSPILFLKLEDSQKTKCYNTIKLKSCGVLMPRQALKKKKKKWLQLLALLTLPSFSIGDLHSTVPAYLPGAVFQNTTSTGQQ